MDNDSTDVALSGTSFHVHGPPTTGKARLATVVNLTGGTASARRLVVAERSGRRLDKSAT